VRSFARVERTATRARILGAAGAGTIDGASGKYGFTRFIEVWAAATVLYDGVLLTHNLTPGRNSKLWIIRAAESARSFPRNETHATPLDLPSESFANATL
jgi:hypothetical protein